MSVITVFPKQNRNQGTYTFNTTAVPAGVNFFDARGLLNASDIIDPTLTMTWKIEASYQGPSGPWVFFIGGGWQGGLDGEGNPVGAPNQTWQSSGPIPTHVRGELVLSQRINMGIEIEFLTK